MNNVKKLGIFLLAALTPGGAFAAANCDSLPACEDIGFVFSASDCGALQKLKCPFGNKYFCSKTTCVQATVNSTTQYCSAYCEDVPSMCVAAAYKPCNDGANGLFANNSLGTLHAANSTISSTSANRVTGNHYLLGNLSSASTSYYSYFQGVHFYSAGAAYPGNCASSMNGTAKLTANAVYMYGTNIFETDVDFKRVNFSPSTASYFYEFDGNTHVNFAVDVSSSVYTKSLSLHFYGLNKTAEVCIVAVNGSFDSGLNKLELNIDARGTTVKYYVYETRDSYVELECEGNNCVKDDSVCSEYDYYF